MRVVIPRRGILCLALALSRCGDAEVDGTNATSDTGDTSELTDTEAPVLRQTIGLLAQEEGYAALRATVDGRALLAVGSYLERLTLASGQVETWPAPNNASYIFRVAGDADGITYASLIQADPNAMPFAQILRFDPAGEALPAWVLGETGYDEWVSGLTVADGKVLVAGGRPDLVSGWLYVFEGEAVAVSHWPFLLQEVVEAETRRYFSGLTADQEILVALDHAGAEQWRTALPKRPALAAWQDTVVCAMAFEDGVLLRAYAADGEMLWESRYTDPGSPLVASRLFVADSGVVYLAGDAHLDSGETHPDGSPIQRTDGFLLGYRATTGEQLWAVQYGEPQYHESFDDMDVTPEGDVLVLQRRLTDDAVDYAVLVYGWDR